MRAADYNTDLCVFIGRFRPPHSGHMEVIKTALQKSSKVLILVGSANQPRSLRNPFTFHEVERMIKDSIPSPADRSRVLFRPLEDASYNDEEWVQSVQAAVRDVIHGHFISVDHPRISLIGHAKDHTSYYLKLFPQWGAINVPQFNGLSATAFREAIFSPPKSVDLGHLLAQWKDDLPKGVINFLLEFIPGPDWHALRDEADAVAAYKAPYKALPFPPIFVSVDAVVVQSGHILMIRRGKNPGKGLWALPGGYLNADEPISSAWYRELVEETGLALPEKDVRGALVATQVFDDPHRDARGRMITHAHLVHLPPGPLPAVTGSDDADEARWIPLADLSRRVTFADHFSIVRNLVTKLDRSL